MTVTRLLHHFSSVSSVCTLDDCQRTVVLPETCFYGHVHCVVNKGLHDFHLSSVFVSAMFTMCVCGGGGGKKGRKLVFNSQSNMTVIYVR